MKEGGGTDDDRDKDLNQDDIEIELDSNVNAEEPQVYVNNRTSNIGGSSHKMKPERAEHVSPENDVF